MLTNAGISKKPEYCVELKIDGLKIILTYKNGNTYTRGNAWGWGGRRRYYAQCENN